MILQPDQPQFLLLARRDIDRGGHVPDRFLEIGDGDLDLKGLGGRIGDGHEIGHFASELAL